MIQLGVPKEMVQQKMRNDNINPEILEYVLQFQTNKQAIHMQIPDWSIKERYNHLLRHHLQHLLKVWMVTIQICLQTTLGIK